MKEGPRIYNLFPLLAGTIQQWGEHIRRIARMEFNWIYLNPFHYPGFSGSLYAIKDYYRPHTLMASGEEDMCQLIRSFCRQAAEEDLSVIMDLVINHTAKDSTLVTQNPRWFRREVDGSLYSPRAIDPADSRKVTIWGDLAELDYKTPTTRESLISYFGNMIGYFIDCGIRGFRCDAAYQIPADVWHKLISFARSKNKDVLFFAETLGCRLEETRALRSAGFDYLFNSAKWWDCKSSWLLEQYESFRHIAPSVAFPESHDTNRLSVDLFNEQGITETAVVERAYRLHYLRTAMFSTGIMMPVGYEFGFSRKLHVVTMRPQDWESPRFDLSSWIGAVNHLKAVTRVLNIEGPQYLVQTHNASVIGLVRRLHDDPSWVMTYINTDLLQPHDIEVQREGLDTDMTAYRDVTPDGVDIILHIGDILTLAPGEVRVFVNM